jgi:hypothetical protein
VKMRDHDGVDRARVDPEVGHRHQRCRAAVDQDPAIPGREQDAGLLTPAVAECVTSPDEPDLDVQARAAAAAAGIRRPMAPAMVRSSPMSARN